jgi:hypothetical protein
MSKNQVFTLVEPEKEKPSRRNATKAIDHSEKQRKNSIEIIYEKDGRNKDTTKYVVNLPDEEEEDKKVIYEEEEPDDNESPLLKEISPIASPEPEVVKEREDLSPPRFESAKEYSDDPNEFPRDDHEGDYAEGEETNDIRLRIEEEGDEEQEIEIRAPDEFSNKIDVNVNLTENYFDEDYKMHSKTTKDSES